MLESKVYSYVKSANDKQANFTGQELRQGIWILLFLMVDIFERGRKKPTKPASTPADDQPPAPNGAQPGPPSARAPASGDIAEAAAIPANPSDAAVDVQEEVAAEMAGANAGEDDREPDQDADPARELLRELWGSSRAGEDDPLPDDEEESSGAARAGDAADKELVSAVKDNANFDRKAYRWDFPDTPPHAPIPAMFAEYALLVGRITPLLGAAVASPMTLSEGEAIAKQAQEFLLCYAVPILRPLHTTKVHKLLAHLLEAVRMHGNIMNGDAGHNDQRHKDDKGHYARTNKSMSGFLRRLLTPCAGLARRTEAYRRRARRTICGAGRPTGERQ